jgi:serine/threonine-protein kinase
MEQLPGRTLQDRLTAGPLAPPAALRVVAEVAAALAAAHAAGLVHGDVTPSKVMLTPSGAKVSDFGIGARQPDEYHAPAYLAPERPGNGVVRPASDVYSLGLLIFHSLTGRLPRPAGATTALTDAYVEPEALPYISGVGPEVEDVYVRCLARDPAGRPTAAEVAVVLGAAAGIVALPDDVTDVDLVPVPAPGSAGDTRAVDADRPRRRGVVLALVGLVVLALVALAVTVWWPGGQPAQGSAPSNPIGWAPGPVIFPSGAATSGVTGTPGADATLDPAVPTSGPTGVTTGPTPSPSMVLPSGASGTPIPTDAPTAPPATPVPTSTITSTPPPGLLVTAAGGTIVVACVGTLALIVLATPAAGYRLGGYKPGPASQVEAVFTATGHRSQIDATCKNGVATPTVKESPTN